MKIAPVINSLLITFALVRATTCFASQSSSDPCAGSPSVGGNRYGASAASVSATEIDVNLSVCWSGPSDEQLGVGFSTFTLELRDSSGSLVAKILAKSKSTPGRGIYLKANDTYPEGVWQASIPATVTLHGVYNVTVKQTFGYLLQGQSQGIKGTLVSAPFQVTIP
jgi:hypothetical protein